MKTIYIAIAIFIAVTLIGTVLGTTHKGAVHIVAPVVSSVITSFLFIVFLKWEDKLEGAE